METTNRFIPYTKRYLRNFFQTTSLFGYRYFFFCQTYSFQFFYVTRVRVNVVKVWYEIDHRLEIITQTYDWNLRRVVISLAQESLQFA